MARQLLGLTKEQLEYTHDGMYVVVFDIRDLESKLSTAFSCGSLMAILTVGLPLALAYTKTSILTFSTIYHAFNN